LWFEEGPFSSPPSDLPQNEKSPGLFLLAFIQALLSRLAILHDPGMLAPMKVTFYGHACFSVQVAGKTLLFDPFITPNPLAASVHVK
jgi:hypothetical protein